MDLERKNNCSGRSEQHGRSRFLPSMYEYLLLARERTSEMFGVKLADVYGFCHIFFSWEMLLPASRCLGSAIRTAWWLITVGSTDPIHRNHERGREVPWSCVTIAVSRSRQDRPRGRSRNPTPVIIHCCELLHRYSTAYPDQETLETKTRHHDPNFSIRPSKESLSEGSSNPETLPAKLPLLSSLQTSALGLSSILPRIPTQPSIPHTLTAAAAPATNSPESAKSSTSTTLPAG